MYERVLLWFPDVFSSTFLNNKLVMDWFASRGASHLLNITSVFLFSTTYPLYHMYIGYLVLGPDYFLGDPIYLHRGVDPNFDGSTWIPNKRKLADPLVPPWIEAVKAKYGALLPSAPIASPCSISIFRVRLGRRLAHDWYVWRWRGM